MAEQDAFSAFLERKVDADGFTIRYLDTGPQLGGRDPVICIHGAGGLRVSPMHQILARTWRAIAFETPGFATSPANERSRDMAGLAGSLCAAVAALGIASYNLMGTSFGGKLATHMALQEGKKLQSLVLLSPAVFRPAERPPMGTPEERHKVMHAHSERFSLPPSDPEVELKQETQVRRLIGAPRDAALDEKLPGSLCRRSWSSEPRTGSLRREWRAFTVSITATRISCLSMTRRTWSISTGRKPSPKWWAISSLGRSAF
jgi:pimeloyl-ACP methyl ester carboxylesterase